MDLQTQLYNLAKSFNEQSSGFTSLSDDPDTRMAVKEDIKKAVEKNNVEMYLYTIHNYDLYDVNGKGYGGLTYEFLLSAIARELFKQHV
jgi:hypothetical protein